MSVRETLDKIENMVVGASRLPFTEKTLINDNELVHYVEELRNDLPKELNRADEIMRNHDQIIREAEEEAEEIKRKAREYAESITEESEIVKQSREKARAIVQQAQDQEKEIMERTQANADAYANQVFDQLIGHVNGTFQGVRQAEAGLQQALNVLQQAKNQMNQQAAHQQEQHFIAEAE